MEKLFMIIYQNADGVGGDIIVYGQHYNKLIECLVDQYYRIYEIYADQIEEEEPDVVEYITKISEKKHCTKKDVRDFNLTVVGITLQCSELFVGEKGFSDLVEHIKHVYYNWDDGVEDPVNKDAAALINELVKSYDNDEALSRIFETINDKIWCA